MGQQGAYSALDQAIAAIRAASAPEAITSAQNIYGQQQQSQQQAAQLALQQLIAQQNNAYQQQQLASSAAGNQYATLGEGSTLYNLLSGQPMYTAPKQYAPQQSLGWE